MGGVSFRILDTAAGRPHREDIVNRGSTSRLSVGAALTLAFAASCASNGKKIGIRPEAVGAYRFSERVNDDVSVDGTFVVESDTVSIEANPGPCRYDRERSNALVISYICGDVSYVFDRHDPSRNPRYATTVQVMETRTVCVGYTVDSTGRTVCARYHTEKIPREVRRSGVLRPQRIPSDDPSHP